MPASAYYQDRVANEGFIVAVHGHGACGAEHGPCGIAALRIERNGSARSHLSLLGAAIDTSPLRLVASDEPCATAAWPDDFAAAGPPLPVAPDGTVSGAWQHERDGAPLRRVRSLGVASGDAAGGTPARAFAAGPQPDARSVLLTSGARIPDVGPTALAVAAASGDGATTAAAVLTRLRPGTAHAFGPSTRSCDAQPPGTPVPGGEAPGVVTDAQGAAFVTAPEWGPRWSPGVRSLVLVQDALGGPVVASCLPAEQAWTRERR